ncbi:MAG TPA: hypothetical protein VH374_06750 [Polyangia bacterium]|nr:hypothetical protein [Polyangia bacterium]
MAASTTYDFGSDLQNPGHCLLDWYSGANCTGSSENAFDDQWLNVAWRMTSFPFSAQTNPDTKSARIWCYAGLSLDDQSAQGFNIDYIFLSQSPNQY